MTPLPREIVAAHSPDSDDAFMFYALATKKVRSPKLTFRHILEDIESLNRKAVDGLYDLSAISYHAYPYVADKYVLMASGSSIGDGYGPMLVAARPIEPDELAGKRIAVPGKLTEAVVTPFDKIMHAVRERSVEAGLIIHEGQLTYDREGFHRVLDLGRWWKGKYGLPLPLGGNVLLRTLPDDIKSECCRLMRESIQYALDNRDEALTYALQFARDMETSLAEKFIGMYVNHYTLDAGDTIPAAVQKLLDLGHDAGLIPRRVQVEFVR
jgi:1,4-dihydroxy-6-naphthoate synthase